MEPSLRKSAFRRSICYCRGTGDRVKKGMGRASPKSAWIFLAAFSLSVSGTPTWAVRVDNAEGLLIGSEARCVNSRGIPIKEVPDNQVKLACLKDRNVQWACNPDGSHARVEAFRQWESQLMEFKERCASVGGSFAFSDPKFQEPRDASYCSQAQPEVQYSEFETPMCNFVSRCPRVAVTCMRPEDTLKNPGRPVMLPGIPKAVAVAY